MAEALAFLVDVWLELRRVPTWAWWLILNLGAVSWYTLRGIPELRAHDTRPSVRHAVLFCCVVIVSVVGVFGVIWLVAIGEAFDKMLDSFGALNDLGESDRDGDHRP